MSELDWLRKIIAERTPGPWKIDDFDGAVIQDVEDNGDAIIDAVQDLQIRDKDAEFIATMGTVADKMLAVVEAGSEYVKHRRWDPNDIDLGDSFVALEDALAALKASRPGGEG